MPHRAWRWRSDARKLSHKSRTLEYEKPRPAVAFGADYTALVDVTDDRSMIGTVEGRSFFEILNVAATPM